jgi:DNA helicase-2/ATP-dependent DNA helicase PcrA
MRSTLILGGPGTGKTTRLIEIVERALVLGIPPDRVAFVSFTRGAVHEAIDKAVQRFGLVEDDLPWFRTIHSFCYQVLGLTRSQVFARKHRDELAELTGSSVEEDGPLMSLAVRARMTLRGVRSEWEASPRPEVDHGGGDLFEVEEFAAAYESYRRERSVHDFTDMLEGYVNGSEHRACPVDVAVVDEAQDLSALQWQVVEKAFSTCKDIYYAGDDDQAIHVWGGADRERFLNLSCDVTDVLPVSHRLPTPIFELSQQIISRCDSRRYLKEVRSAGKSGTLEWLRDPDDVDLSSGSWLLLARCRHQLDTLAQVARRQGVVYAVDGELAVDAEVVRTIRAYEALRRGDTVEAVDINRVLTALGQRRKLDDGRSYTAVELVLDVGRIWHDALVEVPIDEREYYLMCLRRGERLDAVPRVNIGTIHSSKGREASNVLLITDMTSRIARAFRHDEDSELRVWYVGITRASQALYVLQPRTAYGMRL